MHATSAFETYVLAPLVVLGVVYNVVQLIPSAYLPPSLGLGYASDLFLLWQQRTTVSMQALREAFLPHGALGRTPLVQQWRERFGEEGIERLLWRLSSVDGRVRRPAHAETVFGPRRIAGACMLVLLIQRRLRDVRYSHTAWALPRYSRAPCTADHTPQGRLAACFSVARRRRKRADDLGLGALFARGLAHVGHVRARRGICGRGVSYPARRHARRSARTLGTCTSLDSHSGTPMHTSRGIPSFSC